MQDDDFEARLKTLSPREAQVDPVTAAYAAGRRSGTRAIHQWRGLAVLAAAAAVVPWMMPRQKPVAIPSPQVVIAPVPERAAQQIDAGLPGNVWQLRTAVLEKGLDGLPNTPIPPVRPVRDFDTF